MRHLKAILVGLGVSLACASPFIAASVLWGAFSMLFVLLAVFIIVFAWFVGHDVLGIDIATGQKEKR